MCICDPNKRTPICPSCPPEERAKWGVLADKQGIRVDQGLPPTLRPPRLKRDQDGDVWLELDAGDLAGILNLTEHYRHGGRLVQLVLDRYLGQDARIVAAARPRALLEAALLPFFLELAGELFPTFAAPDKVMPTEEAAATCERAATRLAKYLAGEAHDGERLTATEIRAGHDRTLPMSEQLWRDRAVAAERRISDALAKVPEQLRDRAHGGLVRSVELLVEDAAGEKGTREGLEASLDERKADVAHLRGEIDELAKVLLEEFGGPVISESACQMAVRVLREQRAAANHAAHDTPGECEVCDLVDGYQHKLAELDELLRRWYRADGSAVTLDSTEEVLLRRLAAAAEIERLTARVKELEAALQAACCSGCGKVLADRAEAARHAAGCAKHPLGARILELEEQLDRAAAYVNRLPHPYAGELRQVLGEERTDRKLEALLAELVYVDSGPTRPALVPASFVKRLKGHGVALPDGMQIVGKLEGGLEVDPVACAELRGDGKCLGVACPDCPAAKAPTA